MASSTREKILAVSLRLFNEQGYRSVTMRAIADSLSISVGNLTYHFAKKQDIVAALLDDVFAQMTATADMPAASLAQIDSLFSMMLDTLERCAFFFLDNELKQENGPLHLAHQAQSSYFFKKDKPFFENFFTTAYLFSFRAVYFVSKRSKFDMEGLHHGQPDDQLFRFFLPSPQRAEPL